ncbi:MAG: helix-turn-helix domain-containing protein, partial [Bacilli bacterium]|nr:helix-turn-helix domain-containing protein [Bacilli bacterium]
MDQKRIGHFIAKLRKEKNLTQQELADQLYVTDRAVSHWENGRRLPDISLLKNISDILGVSVNELISGEKFKENNIIKKSDDNIIKTLKDNKKNKQIFKLIIFILIIMLILLIVFGKITLKKNIKPKIKLFSINVQESKSTGWNSNEKLHIKLYDFDSVDLCTEN